MESISSRHTPLEGGGGTHSEYPGRGRHSGSAQVGRYELRSLSVMVPGNGARWVVATISFAIAPWYSARGPSSAMRSSVRAYWGLRTRSPSWMVSPSGRENSVRTSLVGGKGDPSPRNIASRAGTLNPKDAARIAG